MIPSKRESKRGPTQVARYLATPLASSQIHYSQKDRSPISKQPPMSPQSATTSVIQGDNIMKLGTHHHEKQVRFTPLVELNVFDRIDPALKSNLYYTKEEIHLIQTQFRIVASMRRQLMKSQELQETFKEYVNYLKQQSKTSERKRLLDQSRGEPVLVTKRRRTQ